MLTTVLSPGDPAANKTDKKSCPHGTYIRLGLKVRKSGSKSGAAINRQDFSFRDDKSVGLEEVPTLRYHPGGRCLEICWEAVVTIITGGCY